VHGEKRNAYTILVRSLNGRYHSEDPRSIWVDNIKRDLTEIGF
jgi:hypothetical protein